MNVFDYFFENTSNLDKDFLLGSREKISYKELYTNSLKLASYIRHHYGTDQQLVLISPNSIFFITTYLAILKSGNTCIPLNFTIEQENLDFILEATACECVFVNKQIENSLDLGQRPTLNESNILEINETQIISEFQTEFDENKIAEIIFTSGSTGIPKGVMISHKNLITNTSAIIEYLELSSKDIICIVLPFFYCYGLSLLHTHLRVGGSVVLNNTFIFLATVINDIKNYRCTGFAGVPSHFQILLKKSKTFKETDFPHLRYVTQAGGKLHDVFIKEFVDAFPEKQFFVMYGQTEATARLSFLPPAEVLNKLGSIGKGIPGVTLKVVDQNGHEVDQGIEGELVAKGGNIMMGYYNEPEETKKTIKNGWLYTGDIAIKDKDGYFYLVARKKEIIKVGGKRVSPKEIEDVILTVSEVVDCTIKGIEDEILGEALKAIIIVNKLDNIEALETAILKECKKKLALYKIPQFFEFSTKMNVKLTGKK